MIRREVQARVIKDGKELQVFIRRVTFTPEGKVDFKEGLKADGNWVVVPEATDYPPECYLPIVFWDKGKARKKEQA